MDHSKRTSSFVTVALALTVSACAPPPPQVPPPSHPDRAALSPSIVLTQDRVTAGAAFMIEEPGYPPVILTAHHTFGPPGGLNRQLSAEELPREVKRVELYDMFTGQPVCEATRVLPLPAAPFSKPSIAGDVAAFVDIQEVEPAGRLRLSSDEPAVGQWVWLLASVAGGAPIQQALHKARVDDTPPEGFFYRFENSKINLTATSGAPVLDAAGQVIGIHLSSMREGNATIGFAHRAAKFREPLLAALEADRANTRPAPQPSPTTTPEGPAAP